MIISRKFRQRVRLRLSPFDLAAHSLKLLESILANRHGAEFPQQPLTGLGRPLAGGEQNLFTAGFLCSR